jgi:hypothetical protein
MDDEEPVKPLDKNLVLRVICNILSISLDNGQINFNIMEGEFKCTELQD